MSRVVHVISIESRLDNFCDLYINAELVAIILQISSYFFRLISNAGQLAGYFRVVPVSRCCRLFRVQFRESPARRYPRRYLEPGTKVAPTPVPLSAPVQIIERAYKRSGVSRRTQLWRCIFNGPPGPAPMRQQSAKQTHL